MRRASGTTAARMCWCAWVAALAFGAGPSSASAAGATAKPAVWVAPALKKIRPSEPAGAGTLATISAARNEFEAFQVVVTGAARGVTAGAGPLTGPAVNGKPYVLRKDLEVRVYAEPLISLRRASSSDPESTTGAWPDALVPAVDEIYGEERKAFPFDSRAGESHAIWFEVFVPSGAPPGKYGGTVTVTAGGSAYPITVDLTVRNFTLPPTATAKSAFSLAWGSLPTGFGFSSSDLTTFTKLRRAFGWFALDHRVSLSHIDDGYAYSDMNYFADNYGDLLDGTSPARLSGAKLTSVEYLGNNTTGDLSRWSQQFYDRGWSRTLFQYTCDEPPSGCAWSDVTPRADAAHSAQPRPVRTLVTATIDDASANHVDGVIDLLTPVVNYMDDKSGQPYPGDQRPKYDTFLGLASSLTDPPNELWMYQSCMSHDCGGSASWATGWPSYMIDASAARNRAMQWMLYRFRATGELYWETGYALYAMTNAWADQWAYTGNGDGTLFYPGTVAKIGGQHPIPIASIRLKMIREGMEDFEYLKKLEACNGGNPTQGMSFATALFPTAYAAGDYKPDDLAASLLTTRDRIASAIEAAVAVGACSSGLPSP